MDLYLSILNIQYKSFIYLVSLKKKKISLIFNLSYFRLRKQKINLLVIIHLMITLVTLKIKYML